MTVRGCGRREVGGLYACAASSPIGMPLEYFLVDPAVPWRGPKLRAPMKQYDSKGVAHLIFWIGAKFYPFFPDFYEEALVLGVSKRVPRDFDPRGLVPGKSKMLLVHPRAIPKFEYDADFECPVSSSLLLADEGALGWQREAMRRKAAQLGEHECVGALWPLSALRSFSRVHEVEEGDGVAVVRTPSATYAVRMPRRPSPEDWPRLRWQAGLVLAVPLGRFEWVAGEGQRVKPPREVERRFLDAGWELAVCEE